MQQVNATPLEYQFDYLLCSEKVNATYQVAVEKTETHTTLSLRSLKTEMQSQKKTPVQV